MQPKLTFFSNSVPYSSIANVLRASGCEVPEYMLEINKPNKSEKKKLDQSTVEREKILTVPKLQKHRPRKSE